MPELSTEAANARDALFAAKAKAFTLDLAADTKLSEAVKKTSESYDHVCAQHVALADELQGEIDSFLSLDFGMIKNKAIPFGTRFDIVKKAAGKVIAAANRINPILQRIDSAKGVLQNVSGDSFTDVPQAASKDMREVTSALKNVENQFSSLQDTLLKVKKDTEVFDSFTGDAPEEDNFLPAIFLGIKVASGAVGLLRNLF